MRKKCVNIFPVIAIALLLLIGCTEKNEIHFEGDAILFFNGEKYSLTNGIYDESDNVLGKTDNGFTIYEVEGDKAHNYLVARSFLDDYLYVRESFFAEKKEIEEVYLTLHKSYGNDKKLIKLIQEIMKKERLILNDPEEIKKCQSTGLYIGVKYKGNPVGEKIGCIKKIGNEYLIYLFNNEAAVLTESEVNTIGSYDKEFLDIITD